MKISRPIPTHIITGFLGSGKTTAILALLKNKPENENWAVLVNEFGQVGVDGALISGQTSGQQIYMREVPGGCMCCVSGLPMQIALNQLLSEAKPDRLLIEPSGLGHPIEVLDKLTNDYYQGILKLQSTVTLVDARNLADERYTQHEIFNQQIDIADIIIGHKADLYQPSDNQALEDYLKRFGDKQLIFTDHGQIDFSQINQTSAFIKRKKLALNQASNQQQTTESVDEAALPESGFLRLDNEGEGFFSSGWRFNPSFIFHRHALQKWLFELQAERIKAVFITSDGIFGYNKDKDGLTEYELDEAAESRIEIIAKTASDNWQDALFSCQLTS
ncbi:GTP-binding protein [Catenovulum sp. SM1970]|uniref:CobW family GTP-binding protein n=1 Tax=Marinifaba aquimaris TaxID=2741323 RepID=UPI001574C3BA|nr:GTP-binding protein [Marinifaba aquimaris]NTS77246.1 GTP-binding protein [Marinifaba aquimaris]